MERREARQAGLADDSQIDPPQVPRWAAEMVVFRDNISALDRGVRDQAAQKAEAEVAPRAPDKVIPGAAEHEEVHDVAFVVEPAPSLAGDQGQYRWC